MASRVEEVAACRHEDRRLCELAEVAHLVVRHGVDFRVCFQGDGDRSGVQVAGLVGLGEVPFLAWATYAWILTSPARSSFPILEAG